MNETVQNAAQAAQNIPVVKEIAIASPAMDQFYTIAMYAVGIIGFLLAIALFYIIIILRDASYVSQKAKETSDTLNEYVRRPAGILMRFFSNFEGIGEVLFSQVGKLISKKTSKKKTRDEDEE